MVNGMAEKTRSFSHGSQFLFKMVISGLKFGTDILIVNKILVMNHRSDHNALSGTPYPDGRFL